MFKGYLFRWISYVFPYTLTTAKKYRSTRVTVDQQNTINPINRFPFLKGTFLLPSPYIGCQNSPSMYSLKPNKPSLPHQILKSPDVQDNCTVVRDPAGFPKWCRLVQGTIWSKWSITAWKLQYTYIHTCIYIYIYIYTYIHI